MLVTTVVADAIFRYMSVHFAFFLRTFRSYICTVNLNTVHQMSFNFNIPNKRNFTFITPKPFIFRPLLHTFLSITWLMLWRVQSIGELFKDAFDEPYNPSFDGQTDGETQHPVVRLSYPRFVQKTIPTCSKRIVLQNMKRHFC